MLIRRLASALVPVAALAALPAAAEWREASSDHFIIYADSGERWIRSFAEKLERFDSAMRVSRALPAADAPRSNRLVIYVLPDLAAMERLSGSSSVAGFYIARAGNSVAFTSRPPETNSELALRADTILYHEYSHHFLLTNAAAAFPRWFSEGYAEFNGNTVVNADGSVGLGRVAMSRAYGLLQLRKLPIEQLLDPPAKPMGPETIEVFYGRSWLLVHYLTFAKAREGQLTAYLSAINAGKPNLEAARAAFGDLRALDKELDRYISARMNYAVLPAARLTVGPIEVRSLTTGEAAMMPVRMRSDRGVDDKAAEALVPEARRRAAPFASDAGAQTVLAEAEYDAGNLAEAEAAADRALAADPGRREAMLYKARVLVRRARAEKTRDAKRWSAARDWIVKANRIDPDAAEPLMLFYTSYLAEGATPRPSAVAGLRRAFELSPHDSGLRLLHARQLLIDGKAEDARRVLLPLANNPHSRGDDNLSRRLVALIEAGNASEALAAAPTDFGPTRTP